MPARILSIPLVIAALVFLYLTWEVDQSYSLYIVPWVIALALVFTMSPQINWWWYKRYPPDLKGKLRLLIERHLPYYQRLSKEEQQRFRHRVALYMEANDFMAKGMDEVSPDLKAVAAACAVQLTFGKRDYLMNKFEHLIFFPKPFPSPQYPENYHASEVYEEDGAILFSAEQLMKGFLQPYHYYNIGLHEYAKVFERSFPELEFPELSEGHWQELQDISGFPYDRIQAWINLDPIPIRPVSISLFFTHPQAFYQRLPELYEAYARLFNQSPGRSGRTILGPLE
jgi:Mlc titration factor MtfA (ptsG expression regulator)